MEAGVLARRMALAAVIAAGLLAGVQVQPSAETSADEGAVPGVPKSEDSGKPGKPGEGVDQQKAEDSAAKLRLVSILGREVVNREGDGGRVIDVLVDLDGRSGAVVVEFGGFLGIGSRKVAVDWGALRFVREGSRSQLTIDISREQIREAPEYKPSEPPAVLTTK